MIRLIDPGAPIVSRLPPGRDVAAWHAALSDEIARHLSPAHASLLARPEMTAGGLGWVTEGGASSRYATLTNEERRALDAAMGAILSDIRRLAESGAAPAVRAAWPVLREIPDMGHVFAVDGRPVLAGWGHGAAAGGGTGAVRLARLDDGVAWRATPRVPWARYMGMLSVLALLALAAGLLLPFAGHAFTEQPASCAAVPSQLAAMRDQTALESRGAELQTLLATLTEEAGRRQLQCPLPVAPAAAPVPMPMPMPVPRVPPPRADLPQEQWDHRDLAMLEGCWNLTSTLHVGRDENDQVNMRTWRQCFDAQGHGRQVEVLVNNASCSGPLTASFDAAGKLHISEPAACTGPTLTVGRSERICQRGSDSEATCQGVNLEGRLARRLYSATFHR